MSEMLIPKYLNVETILNDAILLTVTKIHFGYLIDDHSKDFELELNPNGNIIDLVLKIGNETELYLADLEKTRCLNGNKYKFERNDGCAEIKGYIEYTSEMKANKYLNYENYDFAINFDFIPKIFIKNKIPFISTKTNFTAKLVSNYQITSILTSENLKISGITTFCEQKGIQLILSDISIFNLSNIYKLCYRVNTVFSLFQPLTIENNNSQIIKIKANYSFKKPYAKGVLSKKKMIDNAQNPHNKENQLINNLKILYNLNQKLKLENKNKKIKNTFKKKLIKFKDTQHILSEIDEEEIKNILNKQINIL